MTALILQLDPCTAPSRIGGKAAALAVVDAAGLAVPRSLVLPAETPDDMLESAASQILAWAANIDPFGIVARSSAPAEDGHQASFAGLLRSCFVPLDQEQIATALRTVRTSATAPAVGRYSRIVNHSIDSSIAVLIQPALRPYASGVLGAELKNGQITHWRIEAVHGLAEPLVSGKVTGETHQGRTSTPAEPTPGRQAILVLPGTKDELQTPPGEWIRLPHPQLGQTDAKIAFSADGLLQIYQPATWSDSPVLAGQHRTGLLRLAEHVSTILHLDRIDLEWALMPTGKLFVLQARPLTTALPEPRAPGLPENGNLHWHGIPSSPGCATGITVHLGQGNLSHDSILICPALTISTVSALLAQPAAIVAATGGSLSHTAILARELGIPCITNVTDAMKAIPPGLDVQVDGTTGTIRAISTRPAETAVAPQSPRTGETSLRATCLRRVSARTEDGTATIIDWDSPRDATDVLEFLTRTQPGASVLLADPRSAAPDLEPHHQVHPVDHLIRLISPNGTGRPPSAITVKNSDGKILHRRPRQSDESPMQPADVLPEDLAEFARTTLGTYMIVANRSWPYHGSEVYELLGPREARFILKRHRASRYFQMELDGYRWAPILGPGRAPQLLAADPQLHAIIMARLPGSTLLDSALSRNDELEAYHQAGQLLRRFHSAIPLTSDTQVIDQLLSKIDQFQIQVGDELTPRQHARVREQATRLAELAPALGAVATHGDFQPRNLLWDPATRHLALIDFEKATPAPAIRDLARIGAGPLRDRADLRASFYQGLGRTLTSNEHEALAALIILDSLSGLAWGIPNGDTEIVNRARAILSELAQTTKR